jgi:uncharacterized protein (UPF0333 family)
MTLSDTILLYKDVLSLFLLLILVGFLIVFIWGIYKRFKNEQNSSDRTKHTCKACSKVFQCRSKPIEQENANNVLLNNNKKMNNFKNLTKDKKTNEKEDVKQEIMETKMEMVPTSELKKHSLKLSENGLILKRRRIIPSEAEAKLELERKSKTLPANVKLNKNINRNNVGGFDRKTVMVGNFPIEIANTNNKNCCTVPVGEQHIKQYYCSYQCYRKLIHT